MPKQTSVRNHANATIVLMRRQTHSVSRALPGTRVVTHVQHTTHAHRTRSSYDAFRLEETKNEHIDITTRYDVRGVLGRFAVRVLILLLIFQPVYVAFGMELEEPTQEASATQEASTDESSSEEDDVSDSDTDIEPDSSFDTGEDVAPTDDIDAVESEENTSSSDGESHEDSTEANPMNTGDDTHESSNNVDEVDDSLGDIEDEFSETDETLHEDTDENTDGDDVHENVDEGDSSGADITPQVEGVATTSDDEMIERATTTTETATSTATTSDESFTEEGNDMGIESLPQNAENAFVFSDGDCTLVAEGEFYCVKNDAPHVDTGDPRVYAQKDREGDREVFYFDGVEVHRITNNSYDDFAPVFDEKTLRIVWQAMINDRLQVMIHDITTHTTRQITSSHQNSSNPDIEGDIVVWQEWVDTNWEVMMTDVDVDGDVYEIEQLTDNAVHDMFPRAYEDLVTWQSERGSSWEVVVYDLHTKKQMALKKDEGTKYENPRFVLLFDSKHENGDVETIGYDLDTGEMMELGTKANPQPHAPASPKDETPDAPPREATTTAKVKTSREGDDEGGDMPL